MVWLTIEHMARYTLYELSERQSKKASARFPQPEGAFSRPVLDPSQYLIFGFKVKGSPFKKEIYVAKNRNRMMLAVHHKGSTCMVYSTNAEDHDTDETRDRFKQGNLEVLLSRAMGSGRVDDLHLAVIDCHRELGWSDVDLDRWDAIYEAYLCPEEDDDF